MYDEPNSVPDEDVEETIQQDTLDESDLAFPQEGNPENLGNLQVHQQVYI